MRRILSAAVAAVLVAALAAPALASGPPVKRAKLDVDRFQFLPGTLHVKKGTKVVWRWVDGSDQAHNISVRRGPVKFHSRTKRSGIFTHVFTKPGTYHLYCTLHTFMTETVVVK